MGRRGGFGDGGRRGGRRMGKRLNKISGETGDARTLRKSLDGFFLRVRSIPELVVRESVPVSPENFIEGAYPILLDAPPPPISESPAAGCIKAELHAARVGIPDGGSGLS